MESHLSVQMPRLLSVHLFHTGERRAGLSYFQFHVNNVRDWVGLGRGTGYEGQGWGEVPDIVQG